jgi:tellurite methyltransferase
MNNEYDLKYSGEKFYWGIEPDRLIIELTNMLKPEGSILDLGSGEGRNAVFLAKKGFDVTAVDISENGIMKTRKLAETHDVQINTHISDIIEFISKSPKYDAILCMNILQFIDAEKIRPAIDSIKEKTLPNGFNVIASFVAENENMKEQARSRNMYLFDKGELKKFYDGWKLFEYREFFGPVETHGEKPHRHYIVQLVAQKIIF